MDDYLTAHAYLNPDSFILFARSTKQILRRPFKNFE